MGRKRTIIIADRPIGDDYKLDKITGKVKTISVYQGVFEGVDEFAFVQKSRYTLREPREVEIWEHTIRGVQRHDMFSPIIFDTPPDMKWCSNCGDWVSKRGFSPKKDTRDGLHPICKTCRAERERSLYWQRKAA